MQGSNSLIEHYHPAHSLFFLWMSLVDPHYHLSKTPLLDQTSFDTMLEIFKGERGSMMEDNLIHINIILLRKKVLLDLDLDLQYSTYITYISAEINQDTKKDKQSLMVMHTPKRHLEELKEL
jgi:hypothetical protein